MVGVEYREDEINSIPNEVAREGRFVGYFKDGGAVGNRDITELFMETELRLLEDVPLAQDLSLNLALRWTEESTYGSDTTYRAKGVYRPFTGITFRGTSFRAPNTHEQFLTGTSGLATVYDPCVVPIAAREASLNPNESATYNLEKDLREQATLDNCRANGVDPTMLGLDGLGATYRVERLRKGGQQVQLEIDPETSTTYTYGMVLDQPFWDTFTLRAGVTYSDVRCRLRRLPSQLARQLHQWRGGRSGRILRRTALPHAGRDVPSHRQDRLPTGRIRRQCLGPARLVVYARYRQHIRRGAALDG